MRFILFILGIAAVVLTIIAAMGMQADAVYEGTVSKTLPFSREEVWSVLNNFKQEDTFEIIEKQSEKHLVVASKDPKRGSRTYTLQGEGSATLITISEKSEINNTVTRGLAAIRGRNSRLKKELRRIEQALKAAD